MLATIIINSFKRNTARDLFNAIDDCCSATDNCGWASAGVYCFWNLGNNEICYIGLAVNLAQRFAQHTGLIACDKSCCKIEQIDAYFKRQARLGYSVFLQSPLSQVSHSKTPKSVRQGLRRYAELAGLSERYEISELEREISAQGYEEIVSTEGLLIEAHRNLRGAIPVWNKIGGQIHGRTDKDLKPAERILYALTTRTPNFLVARSTLQTLSKNAVFKGYETYLHAVRVNHLIFGASEEQTWTMAEKQFQSRYHSRIKDSAYLERVPIL